jgi:hypothetical protein
VCGGVLAIQGRRADLRTTGVELRVAAGSREPALSIAIAAANHMGLCMTGPEDARNNDSYLLGMLRARLNH